MCVEGEGMASAVMEFAERNSIDAMPLVGEMQPRNYAGDEIRAEPGKIVGESPALKAALHLV